MSRLKCGCKWRFDRSFDRFSIHKIHRSTQRVTHRMIQHSFSFSHSLTKLTKLTIFWKFRQPPNFSIKGPQDILMSSKLSDAVYCYVISSYKFLFTNHKVHHLKTLTQPTTSPEIPLDNNFRWNRNDHVTWAGSCYLVNYSWSLIFW